VKRPPGKTILMSSHSFEEVERTCDSIGIIRLGRLAAVESIAALRAAQRKVYAVTFADETEAQRFGETDFEILSVSGSKVEVVIFSNLAAFLSALPDFQVIALDTVQQSLEDVFMQYFGKEGAV
jgi:ABC-2 type transport system ATP-binding protein